MELVTLVKNARKIAAVFVFAAVTSVFAATSESASSAFIEACKSYSRGDWADAKIMLKKAVSYSENMNPDAYYMLITSEIYDGDNRNALDDCNFFIESFPDSMYYPRICYQKGKLLYSLGEYEKAIVILSDFCHRYENDELYSYALFYIGESLFAGYKYDEAGAIYEQIVKDYPDSPKTPAAQYRLESILQRGREEKLLYLLKQTGEEYLSAKEEYERQLRLYNSESLDSTRQKLAASQKKNEELELQIQSLEKQVEELRAGQTVSEQRIQELQKKEQERERDVPSGTPFDERAAQVKLLKQKALEAQQLLDKKNENGGQN